VLILAEAPPIVPLCRQYKHLFHGPSARCNSSYREKGKTLFSSPCHLATTVLSYILFLWPLHLQLFWHWPAAVAMGGTPLRRHLRFRRLGRAQLRVLCSVRCQHLHYPRSSCLETGKSQQLYSCIRAELKFCLSLTLPFTGLWVTTILRVDLNLPWLCVLFAQWDHLLLILLV